MEKRSYKVVILTLISLCLIAGGFIQTGFGQERNSWEIAQIKASQLLNLLSPEERVGQLFLLTFDGTNITENIPIHELITNYHIGGVMLKRSNDNFPAEDVVETTYSLITGLQEIEWESRNAVIENNVGATSSNYIPLLIGISQSGDSFPNDQILTGLTALPSQMAIGATWNRDLAREAGMILGRELSSLGINMVIGPSLDVIESPFGEGRGDLGVRTFGGDPYWVGELGKAYISGLNAGSNNKIAVVAKNFPGRGSSDRLPEEEVATVRKSIEQLKLIELAPFFAVTDVENKPKEYIVDGLLLSHIRYQGFQGNIRATTRPVSFDQPAVDLLMGLPPFSAWRSNGGILVSDDLGSQAVRRFFNPTGQHFDGRQIARNAFLSGNDLLFMDQLISTNDTNRFQTYSTVIEHFVQKYREDLSFAERVDASVLRILTLKFKIYPEFEWKQIIPDQRRSGDVDSGQDSVFQILSQAVTLISPRSDQISEAIPEVPGISDRLVIFTDILSAPACSTCPNMDIVPIDGLQQAILRLYGPGGSGQIAFQNIISYPFFELQNFVDNPYNHPELESNLSRANWVVFLTHDQNPDRPGAYALHQLLSRKPEVLRNKTVLLFSLNAPYYYDATEISYFSAYYGLYSKVAPAFDVIARVIFQELMPAGSSPVTIPGIAYNLISVTAPHPDQVIELYLDEEIQGEIADQDVSGISIGERITDYILGDNIPIRTGIIRDHNTNPVPDGTVVRFSLNIQGESLTIQQVETTTMGGVARASFKLQSTGLHEIRAVSEPAMNSQILILDVTEDQGAIISAIIPTPVPTMLSEDLAAEEELTSTEETMAELKRNSRFVEWLTATSISWALGLFSYYSAGFLKTIRERLMIAGSVILGGLVVGYWFVFNLPGDFLRIGIIGFLPLLLITIFGGLLGGGAGWLYLKR